MGKRDDFALEARTLPIAQQALGLCFMLRATEEQDQKEATDVVMLRLGVSCVAVRIRRPGAHDHWRCGPDVTLRLWRPSGRKTEWAKVMEEEAADFMLYGILGREQPDVLGKFVVLDLRAVRAQWSKGFGIEHQDKTNRDGTAFRALKTAYLDPKCFHSAFRWPMTPEQIRHAHLPRPVGEWCEQWTRPEVIHMHEIGMAQQARLW